MNISWTQAYCDDRSFPTNPFNLNSIQDFSNSKLKVCAYIEDSVGTLQDCSNEEAEMTTIDMNFQSQQLLHRAA